MFLTDTENYIICGSAIIIAIVIFCYFYKIARKNEDYEERFKAIRSRLRIGAYAEAMDLTDIDYQYKEDCEIDITDGYSECYEIILGEDRLYIEITEKNGRRVFDKFELIEDGNIENLRSHEMVNYVRNINDEIVGIYMCPECGDVLPQKLIDIIRKDNAKSKEDERTPNCQRKCKHKIMGIFCSSEDRNDDNEPCCCKSEESE